MTVLDLISDALSDLGQLQEGEAPSADAADVSLRRLNDWIDALKLEGLSILNANDVAISNDNDFGIGEVLGTPSRLTILLLSDRLPLRGK